MSHVMKYADCSATDFSLLLMIADSVNPDHGNQFWMKAGNLAIKARVGRQKATEALKEFVEQGWLEETTPTVIEGRPTGRPGRYRFLFPILNEPVYDPEAKISGGTAGDDTGVPPATTRGVAPGDTKTQGNPNEDNDSCRTPSAIDDESTQGYIAEFTERLRREGVEMVALRAVDGEADAIEMIEVARMLVNARAQPMGDRPEAEKFEDTPAYRLCTFFVDAIMEADPEGKRPSITRAWVQEAGRILNPKVDGRQPGEIRAIINWIFRSNDPEGNWWQPNIRSIKKFRAQYDTLRLKMQASATAQQTRTASRGVQQQPQGAPVQFGTDGKATEAYRVWEREQRAAMKADMIAEVGEAAIEQMRADGRLPAWWDDV